jgi:TonB family protein
MLDLLVNTAVRMLLMSLAVWLALRLLRVRNPHVEALAWRMLLLAGLTMPVVLLSGMAPTVATTVELPVVLVGSGAGDAAAMAGRGGSMAAWLGSAMVAIYLAGALLLLGRLAAGLLRMRRVCADARSALTHDDVRISARLRSPATFGTVILLPEASETWSAQTRDAVLAHERAHVRSRDGYWSWLAQMHAAIFWFSPVAWWLRRRLEMLAETTSDDAVVAARHDPIVYASLLLDFARLPNYRSVAMSVAESNVPGRIERLLTRTPPGAELPRRARWLALAALIPGVFLAASTTRVLAQTPPAPATPGEAVRIVKAADPDHFYPAAAKQAKVTGLVLLSVDVDRHGQPVDVRVLEPLTADDPFGFGPAAAELARRSQYSNPFPRVATIRFKVKFALTSDPPVAARAFAKIRSAGDPDLFYPPGAKLRREQGSPVVQSCVGPDGSLLREPAIVETSNYPELDQAAIQVAKGSGYLAATENGKPLEESCIKFKVKFVLTSDPPAASKT